MLETKLLTTLKNDPRTCKTREMPAREAVWSPDEIPSSELKLWLERKGVTRLYSHQGECRRLLAEGRNVAMVTSTASGKSLCYQIPLLETHLKEPEATALLLFPTKALSQDQLVSLQAALPYVRGYHAGVYDGDTPPDLRRRLRDSGHFLLTNPDMLHSGILPNHARWARFFSRLRYVVIDEIHIYRGIFGSHVANVLKRLHRIARHYGAAPQFILCSATLRNAREHAEALAGVPVSIVIEDGSPRGAKTFVLQNPLLKNADGLERESPIQVARRLLVELGRERVQSIAFSKSRTGAELLHRYVREDLAEISPSLAKGVCAYRGGYLPKERRELEAGLRDGRLGVVSSTNALELGIDIGSLDACVIVGYPGSVASLNQQAGRAGRSKSHSLVVLIAQNAPVDQYLLAHPETFWDQSVESAVIDPDNPTILIGHLRCALHEIAFLEKELQDDGAPFRGKDLRGILQLLVDTGEAFRHGRGWYWPARSKSYPAAELGLRSSTQPVYTILEKDSSKVIGTIDESAAWLQVHTHAIYIHDGETYFVHRLDVEDKRAWVEKRPIDYYTQAVVEAKILVDRELGSERFEINGVWEASASGRTAGIEHPEPILFHYGEVTVGTHIPMFKKMKFRDRDSIGFELLSLPEQRLETEGLWLQLPRAWTALLRDMDVTAGEALCGIANLLLDVAPLFTMADAVDLGTVVDFNNTAAPALYVYDRYPGGLGFSERLLGQAREVLQVCLERVEECACEKGCPACVGAAAGAHARAIDSGTLGNLPDKRGTQVLLRLLLGLELPEALRRGTRNVQLSSAAVAEPTLGAELGPGGTIGPRPLETRPATELEPEPAPEPIAPLDPALERKLRKRIRMFHA